MYLHVSKFRMDTLNSIIQGLHEGWWMVSLDLKDAYLDVPIHLSHWWSTFCLPSGTQRGSSLFINGRSSPLA